MEVWRELRLEEIPHTQILDQCDIFVYNILFEDFLELKFLEYSLNLIFFIFLDWICDIYFFRSLSSMSQNGVKIT